MDIEEGRVPYRLFLQAVAYSHAKSSVMPFIEDSVKDKARLEFEARRRREQEKKRPPMPPPGARKPIAQKAD